MPSLRLLSRKKSPAKTRPWRPFDSVDNVSALPYQRALLVHFELSETLKRAALHITPSHENDIERLCREMIAIAPDVSKAMYEHAQYRGQLAPGQTWRLPAHPGFMQLAHLLERRGDLAEATAVCDQAKTQGWAGDWAFRIARLHALAAK